MPRAEDHVPQAWGLSVQSLQNFSQNGKGTVKANLCCKGNLVCTFAHLLLGFRAQIGRGAGWGWAELPESCLSCVGKHWQIHKRRDQIH